MKKLFIFVFTTILCALEARGADGDVFKAYITGGSQLTFQIVSESEKTCQVGNGSDVAYNQNNETEISLPSEVNGYTLVAIAKNAFYSCSILSITIPEGVTSIGQSAFENCTKMASAKIPSTVTTIGQSAFRYCSSLLVVDIPYGVTIIGSDMFGYCKALKSISIPEGVTDIGHHAFGHCDNLSSISLPSTIVGIGSYAFYASDPFNLTVMAGMEKPVSLQANIFESNNTILYVPKGSKDAYMKADYWKDFKSIVEMEKQEDWKFSSKVDPLPNGSSEQKSKTYTLNVNAGDIVYFNYALLNVSKFTITIDGEEKLSGSYTSSSEVNSYSYEFESAGKHTVTLQCRGHMNTICNVYNFALLRTGEVVLPQCAKPTITIVRGVPKFSCETEGVTFNACYSYDSGNGISVGDTMQFQGTTTAHISVFASKDGYTDSDAVTADVDLNVGAKGDVNQDGVVSITDAVSVVNIILSNGAE